MLRNYLTIAFRNFWKYKGFTTINVVGLTLGIGCNILILLWVQDELTTDRFHDQGDQIHSLLFNMKYPDGTVTTWRGGPCPLAEVLETEYPELEHVTLVSENTGLLFSSEKNDYKESGHYASSNFFKVFTFPFIQGDPNKALEDINAVVISRSLATKLFGDKWEQQNVIGKTVHTNFDKGDHFAISGVFEDSPKNSTLKFDFVLPMELRLKLQPWRKEWGRFNNKMFVKVRKDTDVKIFNTKIADVIAQHRPDYSAEDDEVIVAFLYPYADLYLRGNFENGLNIGGRVEYVRIFLLVAILVLGLACINFMNLATAHSFRRAREVGVRKAIGASKRSLVVQFIGETFLMAFMSLSFAILLTELLLPVFNNLTQKQLSVDYTQSTYWLTAVSIIFIISLIAGSYPAFFISSFNTIKVLKGNQITGFGAIALRKGLVVFQFTISIAMIIGALIIHSQIQFIMHRNIGLDRENVFVYYLQQEAYQHYETIKNKLLGDPNILSITAADASPLNISSTTTGLKWEGQKTGEVIEFNHLWVDFDFVKTMGIELAMGRDFSKEISNDTDNVLLNEAAVKALGFENPIGKKFDAFGRPDGQVIGVVKDFHSRDMFNAVSPLVIILTKRRYGMYIRTAPNKAKEVLVAVEKVHQSYDSSYPFEFRFMDEQFENIYRSQLVMGTLSNYFTILAIVICCLGLLGLASFTAEQKTKEIGIRKVYGASIANILVFLSKSYVWLIAIAFVIAVPVSNYFIIEWLSSFEYKTAVSWWYYAVPGILILLIALLTISRQTLKAAVRNPVESLRHE